jgi:gliding motility-associated-like protein
MKFRILFLIVIFYNVLAFSQQEASIWYFGQNAGLDFNSGSPVPLLDGQLSTDEGCATLSDFNGNLLFYTDGMKVYNRNHIIMPNGNDLLGHSSSSQSATIVPKPGSSNLFYLFTVEHESNPNGLRYSIIDLTLDGGLGDITAEKNVLMITPTLENLGVTKHSNGIDYWIVSHGWGNNSYYAFLLTSSGISATPVITNIGATVNGNGFLEAGFIKISPSGLKLAFTSVSDVVQLFDFNRTTGVLSNGQTLLNEGGELYGVEFSPDETVLYVSNAFNKVYQFNLLAANIPNSQFTLYDGSLFPGALQLGPDGKIYLAVYGQNKIGVINNPDIVGVGCGFQINAVDLGGRFSRGGLPAFNQSFFNVSFTAQNFCEGDATLFTLNTNEVITSITWDFGDGQTSSVLNASHQYALAGTYTVTVTATTASQTTTKSRTITISPLPVVATLASNQAVCGINGMNYDLSQFNSSLLGSQSAADFGVAYFSSVSNATAHSNLLNTNYTLPLGVTTIHAKIYSLTNTSCYDLTSFTINLFNQPIANAVSSVFICDDVSNDGVEVFNFSNQNSGVLGSQNAANYTISYHLNQADADSHSNALPFNYQNSSNPQTVYVRIENNLNTACFATTSFQIGVNRMPIAHALQNLVVCDDESNDGIESFNLGLQTPLVLGMQLPTEFAVSYYLTQTDANSDLNALPSLFQNTANPQTIFVRIENVIYGSCFVTTQFDLNVLPKPNLTMNTSYTICEGVPITIEAPIGFSSYSWSTGSVTNATTINLAGSYTLTVTQNYGTESCSDTQTITVLNSNAATITQIQTLDWTDTENSITVIVSGDGVYEYSLDGISYQDGRTFNGLLSGEYTVFVRDKRGCGIAFENLFLLMYPKFFTPNNDGINDTWLIKNSYIEPNMQLFIYNRYGKLLKQFSSLGQGWDGTLSGSLLPADDYWFVVKRENGKEFRGHFAMKR